MFQKQKGLFLLANCGTLECYSIPANFLQESLQRYVDFYYSNGSSLPPNGHNVVFSLSKFTNILNDILQDGHSKISEAKRNNQVIFQFLFRFVMYWTTSRINSVMLALDMLLKKILL